MSEEKVEESASEVEESASEENSVLAKGWSRRRRIIMCLLKVEKSASEDNSMLAKGGGVGIGGEFCACYFREVLKILDC